MKIFQNYTQNIGKVQISRLWCCSATGGWWCALLLATQGSTEHSPSTLALLPLPLGHMLLQPENCRGATYHTSYHQHSSPVSGCWLP